MMFSAPSAENIMTNKLRELCDSAVIVCFDTHGPFHPDGPGRTATSEARG
jgi:hypothetical protein